MKRFNCRRLAWYWTAMLCLTGFIAAIPVPFLSLKAYALMISDEQFEEMLEEEFYSDENVDADDYDIDIDAFTEEYLQKVENGEIDFEGLNTEIIVNPSLTMEAADNGMIRYILPSGDYYDATVPNGMITGSSVSFFPSSKVVAVVTKDGESYNLFRSWRFSEPGNYHIKMLFYEFEAEEFDEHQMYEVNHYFTITDRVAGDFGAVPAPDGFKIVSAKKDGVAQVIENPACLFLDGDGVFEIRYCDVLTETIYAATSFERDITAPFLSFSKEIGEKKVSGPITFTKSDTRDRVYLSYNGHTAETMVNELTEAGKYGLEVVDTAGNRRMYYLEIRQKHNLLDANMIILTLIFLLGTGIRFLLLRKN